MRVHVTALMSAHVRLLPHRAIKQKRTQSWYKSDRDCGFLNLISQCTYAAVRGMLVPAAMRICILTQGMLVPETKPLSQDQTLSPSLSLSQSQSLSLSQKQHELGPEGGGGGGGAAA
eukprot:729975-Rhodomonas_salina.1